MIESSLVQYYRSDAEILSLLNSDNVFLHRAPTEAVMPWVIVSTPTPGARLRLTTHFINPKRILHIMAEAEDQYAALALAELLLEKTDNYRGDMLGTLDVYIRCGDIYTLDGFSGTVTSLFQATAQSLEALTKPVPVA